MVSALPPDRAKLGQIVDTTELILRELPQQEGATIAAPLVMERLPQWAVRLAPVACRLLVEEQLVVTYPASEPRMMLLALTPAGLALLSTRRAVSATAGASPRA